jgi:hypothetical protein
LEDSCPRRASRQRLRARIDFDAFISSKTKQT